MLLAVLLHVWLVLIFGNSAGTTAPGQGLWGGLSVQLLGKGTTGAKAPPPTSGGDPARPRKAAADGVPSEAPSTATLKLPEGFTPVEHEPIDAPTPGRMAPPGSALLPITPDRALATAPPAPLQAPSPELPAAVGRLEAHPEASLVPLSAATDLHALSPARAAEAPSAELPTPVQRLEAPSSSLTPLPRSVDLGRLTPAAAASSALAGGAALPSPVQRLEANDPGGSARQRPQAVAHELRSLPAASAVALPSAQDLPAAVQRLEAVATGQEVSPLTPSGAPRAVTASPTTATALPALSGALPGQVAAQTAGTGKESIAAPPNAASSAPRQPLNLSLPRGNAVAARRGPGLLELLPQPPEPSKSKMEKAIERAANGDCREAYASTGLLAVIPLAVDAVRNKGCKW